MSFKYYRTETKKMLIYSAILLVAIALLFLVIGMYQEFLVGPNVSVGVYINDEVYRLVSYPYVFFTLGLGNDGCIVYEYFDGFTLLGWFTISQVVMTPLYFWYLRKQWSD